ncbi:MAG: hypothetical protein EHM61_03370, partial [Acidobacteria bacterium]
MMFSWREPGSNLECGGRRPGLYTHLETGTAVRAQVRQSRKRSVFWRSASDACLQHEWVSFRHASDALRKKRCACGSVAILALCLIASLPSLLADDTPKRGQTQNPHGTIVPACSACHTSISWVPMRPSPDFDHGSTSFRLRGLHTSVACRRCHVSLAFANVGTGCADCHADLHQAQFGPICEDCHSELGWRVSAEAIKNHQNRFPLVQGHAAVDCQSCHKGGATDRFVGLSTECASCHRNDFESKEVVNHQAFNAGSNCKECHSTAGWPGGRLDHAATGFPLDGGHVSVECASCHTGNRYVDLDRTCASCHLDTFNATQKPDHRAAGLSSQCESCHTTAEWKGGRFDHQATPRFPLTGGHSGVTCSQCHTTNVYRGLASDCASCHLKDYRATSDPSHTEVSIPTDCQACHETSAWNKAKFDHGVTPFLLDGAHVGVDCRSCHVNRKYRGLGADCASCHQTEYDSATDPKHAPAGISRDCATCHNTAAWAGAGFDHAGQTRFPLTGGHKEPSCTSCHTGEVYAGTASDCASCHTDDYDEARDPEHKATGFPRNCESCHSTTTWEGSQFDHDVRTRFPLTGGHKPIKCADCHENGQFVGTPADCASCHTDDFDKAVDPKHAAAGFSRDCVSCHNTASWTGGSFDHDAKTKYPLTGGHRKPSCESCHSSGTYAGTASDCASCHTDDFNAVREPDHKTAGFPTDCARCHTTSDWKGGSFDHSTTKFPLTGGHVGKTCSSCHANGQFAGTASDCASCHAADYDGTTTPKHAAAGFSRDCAGCHNTVAWTGAGFDHDTKTKYPLTGGHRKASCESCHSSGIYAGTASDCASCHTDDYNAVQDPNHKTAGFPTDCARCHSTSDWKGGSFDHSTTKFPLTGGHVGKTCSSCHANGQFAGTASDCASC